MFHCVATALKGNFPASNVNEKFHTGQQRLRRDGDRTSPRWGNDSETWREKR